MPPQSHKKHAIGMFMISLKTYELAVIGSWEIVIGQPILWNHKPDLCLIKHNMVFLVS